MISPLDGPLQVILWGPPGSCKTVRAHTFPRTKTLDFDGGLLSVGWAIKVGIITDKDLEYFDVGAGNVARIREGEKSDERGKYGFIKRPAALDRATDAIDHWLEDLDSWDTLVIDSATALSEFCLLMGMKQMGELGLSETAKKAMKHSLWIPRIQDFGGAKNMFKQFMDWCRSLDKNLVVCCHEYEKTTKSGSLLAYQPLLVGTLREEVPKDFDEVWHCYWEGDGDDRKPMIRTVGDRRHECKSRLGCLDAEEEAFSYDEIMKKVRSFWA